MIVIQQDLMRHRPCILSNHIPPISAFFPTCARLSQTSATWVFLKMYFPHPSSQKEKSNSVRAKNLRPRMTHEVNAELVQEPFCGYFHMLHIIWPLV